MSKMIKVTKEEYDFLQSEKKRKENLDKENLDFHRNLTLERNNLKLTQMRREVEFKQKQVDQKEHLETHEGFTEKVKPSFYLKNEIDEISQKISELVRQNKVIEEELEKDVH